MRVLFISGEVAPFTEENDVSWLVRHLPEQVHETGEYETRIMMPRYGIISERRNRLHEVIRLSGTEVDMAGERHTLKVKVASIPGIRLQVYFMDNAHFFKRKGIVADRDGKMFTDNAARALFLGRAGLETIRNLGWAPDIVHAFGWASGFVPLLLATEFRGDKLFENTKCVFTPDDVDPEASFDEHMASEYGLEADEDLVGSGLCELGIAYADGLVYPPNVDPPSADIPQFTRDLEHVRSLGMEIYEAVGSGVAV